jgi:hypothetical protein
LYPPTSKRWHIYRKHPSHNNSFAACNHLHRSNYQTIAAILLPNPPKGGLSLLIKVLAYPSRAGSTYHSSHSTQFSFHSSLPKSPPSGGFRRCVPQPRRGGMFIVKPNTACFCGVQSSTSELHPKIAAIRLLNPPKGGLRSS